MFRWIKRLFGFSAPKSPTRATQKPRVEGLEDRFNPVTGVTDLTTLTPNALVASLVGSGVSYSNPRFTGAPVAGGTFVGGSNSIGFASGVILGTGSVKQAVGPNSLGQVSTIHNTPSDPDLDQLIAPTFTGDAAVLEFDFVPKGNAIVFSYVYGSEEYYTPLVNDDPFAFYLNGKNVALIPGTSQIVSVGNVSTTANPTYFVNNAPTFIRNVAMDGLTTVITTVVPVRPNVNNHIKLAIQDSTNSIHDSNVFIKAGSFSAADVKAYNPVRYVYNRADRTYSGYITVTNSSNTAIPGPFFVGFTQIPAGVSILNLTGYSSTGIPYVRSTSGIPAKSSARIYLRISNPLNRPLPSFYSGNGLQISNIQL